MSKRVNTLKNRPLCWIFSSLVGYLSFCSQALLGQYQFPEPNQSKSGPLAARDVEESAHLVGHENPLILKRIEDALQEWDPRFLDSPYIKRMYTDEGKRFALRRPDLARLRAGRNRLTRSRREHGAPDSFAVGLQCWSATVTCR